MLNFCIVLCTNDQANQYTVDAIFFLNNEDSIVGFQRIFIFEYLIKTTTAIIQNCPHFSKIWRFYFFFQEGEFVWQNVNAVHCLALTWICIHVNKLDIQRLSKWEVILVVGVQKLAFFFLLKSGFCSKHISSSQQNKNIYGHDSGIELKYYHQFVIFGVKLHSINPGVPTAAKCLRIIECNKCKGYLYPPFSRICLEKILCFYWDTFLQFWINAISTFLFKQTQLSAQFYSQ